ALSEFAEYVEKQQAHRAVFASNAQREGQGQEGEKEEKSDGAASAPTPKAAPAPAGAAADAASTRIAKSIVVDSDEEHALDFVDEMGLSEDTAASEINLKELLLGDGREIRYAEDERAKGKDKDKDTPTAAEIVARDDSLRRLAAILQGRLEEGRGETIFDVGQDDDGRLMDFTRAQWDVALSRVRVAAETCYGGGTEGGAGAAVRVLVTFNVGGPEEASAPNERIKCCAGKVLVRRRPRTTEDVIETRVAVVGNVDAGKSTLLGVLVKGKLDDGRGAARVNLFRHKHEVDSGRTSSVGMEIMGFDAGGGVVGHGQHRKQSWEEIGRQAAKLISFSDLAGHERYLRTTVFGMLSSSPNYCLLMVAANNGLIGMSKEHLGIALSLNVPVMVVVTKVDICPPNILQQTLTQLTRILKSPGARKIPVFIKSLEETVVTATQFVNQRICPIFQVSNVTGENLELVRTFLNILPQHGHYDTAAPFEFLVNDCFSVPFVGTVVAGIVKSGAAHAGDQIVIGPDSLGQFKTTAIKSIERKRLPVHVCTAGQSASFALKGVRRKEVRKGMVVFMKVAAPPRVYDDFVAEGRRSPPGR
ncbi:hypothetical protein KEM52_000757, partial [Ascosphaera acerosa]